MISIFIIRKVVRTLLSIVTRFPASHFRPQKTASASSGVNSRIEDYRDLVTTYVFVYYRCRFLITKIEKWDILHEKIFSRVNLKVRKGGTICSITSLKWGVRPTFWQIGIEFEKLCPKWYLPYMAYLMESVSKGVFQIIRDILGHRFLRVRGDGLGNSDFRLLAIKSIFEIARFGFKSKIWV